MILAVYTSPKTRYRRLSIRKSNKITDPLLRNRPFSVKEAKKRDYAEIENLNKAGPIAIAQYTIINESSIEDLKNKVKEFSKSFL